MILRLAGLAPRCGLNLSLAWGQSGFWWHHSVWGGRTGQRTFEFLSRAGRAAKRRNDNSPAIPGWASRQPNAKVPVGAAEKPGRAKSSGNGLDNWAAAV
jgi:hypothetical protein